MKKILLERFPYRFVEETDRGYIEKNDPGTRRWRLMYDCDSPLQLLTAMEDINYCRWLDPQGVPCYTQGRNVLKSPYRD